MTTTHAQRLLLLMGIVGCLALIVATVTVFGGGDVMVQTFGLAGMTERLLVLHGTNNLSLALTVSVMGVPLLAAGCTGASLELRHVEMSARIGLYMLLGIWIMNLLVYIGALGVFSMSPDALASEIPWPAGARRIFFGISLGLVLTTVGVWAYVFRKLYTSSWALPAALAWRSPLMWGLLGLAAATVVTVVQGPRALPFAVIPWFAWGAYFAMHFIYRLRHPSVEPVEK